MAVRLVSFADGPFTPRKEGFIREAEALGLFDSITVHSFDTLPEEFRQEHEAFILTHKKGFGYWIWKPRIILDELLKSSADDVVFYSDAGFTIQAEGRLRFCDYIALVRESRFKMLSFFNIHTEYRWTKRDLAERLGVTDILSVMATSQIASGFFGMMPTESNIDLMKEWAEIAVQDDYHYSNDAPSLLEEHPEFIAHRHDASIGSLLRKLRGTTLTHYEVQSYAVHFDRLKPKLPMLATRRRS